MVSQKSQWWLAENSALVNVDKLGTFSDKYSGTPSWSTYRGQGEFPDQFGLPVAAKLVQAATSSSESVISDPLISPVVQVFCGAWFIPRMPPCQPGNRNWMSIVWAARGTKPGMGGK